MKQTSRQTIIERISSKRKFASTYCHQDVYNRFIQAPTLLPVLPEVPLKRGPCFLHQFCHKSVAEVVQSFVAAFVVVDVHVSVVEVIYVTVARLSLTRRAPTCYI